MRATDNLRWEHERSPLWDIHKAAMIGDAPPGRFDDAYRKLTIGASLPGDWWRVERENQVLGFGWLDVVSGDAEILLVTAPRAQRQGVGGFILAQLLAESRQRGLNYVYNTVRPDHPEREALTAWLVKHGFHVADDGVLRLRTSG